MNCATGMRRIIQEIDRKTKVISVNVTPARKCKFSSGITVNVHRREQLIKDWEEERKRSAEEEPVERSGENHRKFRT